MSQKHLTEAADLAAAAGLDISYQQVDTNTCAFEFDDIDLVVNFAAMHHVAYIDRVMRRMCEILPEDGAFMSWDYIGPHRNQYSARQWEAMWDVNTSLPVSMRKSMAYPHLPTMLAADPTEAIHSELIMDTMRRYFHLDHVRYLGGAIAYELLCFNDGFFDGRDHTALVQHLMDIDAAYMSEDPEANTLFVFVLARPNKAALTDTEQLASWTVEENTREAEAVRRGGRYYPDTMLSEYFEDLQRARTASHPEPPRLNKVLFRQVGSACKRSLRELATKWRLTNG